MPLSEHEQKLLEQMEQQLLADDPRFATTMRDQRRSVGGGRRRTVVGVSIILAGLGLVVLSLLNSADWSGPWLGVLAIVAMFAGLIVALTGPRSTGPGPLGTVGPDGRTRPGGSRRSGPPAKGRARGQSTFMQRLEQRWDRRRDDR